VSKPVLILGVAAAALSFPAAAQALFDVQVVDGAVVVERADSASFAKGATWRLKSSGWQFAATGVTVTGPGVSQSCASSPDRQSVSCRVAGFQPGGGYGFKVHVVAADTQKSAPPTSDVFIVND
jgi:hypothetical protein